MAKIGRNAPCPCASGKKYKNCCLGRPGGIRPLETRKQKFVYVYTELDQLSNKVYDLIQQKKMNAAEKAGRKLLADYPEQIDGLHRLGQVYEARGNISKASEYYQKAADFAGSNPGFDKHRIEGFLSDVRRMKSQMKGEIEQTGEE